jgi:acylpyruvate hydrolase
MNQQESIEVPDYSLVSWRRPGDSEFATGLVHQGSVWPLAGVPEIDGDVIRACLVAQDSGVEHLASLVTGGEGAVSVSVDDVELGPPVPQPQKILCLGLNYQAHADGSGFEVPPVPVFFAKFRNSLLGATGEIVIPRISQDIDYEAELAVVIGRQAKYVPQERALEYVAGYSVFNDVSARDLQLQTSQWTAGKALDTFAPMGPGLVPAALISDPQNLMITTKVNGEVTQHETTGKMVKGIAETIAFISSVMTLEPGDIIATGTPAGVVFEKEHKKWLEAGDVVEVAIEGLGTIRNKVVAESTAPSDGSPQNEAHQNEAAPAGTR